MSYYNAERAPGKVVLYLYPQYTVHPPPPFELQSSLSPEEWDGRLRVITRTAYRHSKPLLERVWVITAVFATFLIPMALYRVIFDALHIEDRKSSHGSSSDKQFEARAIAFGVFVGTSLLFWTPLFFWKLYGRRKMLTLVRRWAEADVLARDPGAFVPMWHVRTPGIFESRTVLTITTPPFAPPTAFHPNAYLPPYVNQPGTVYPTYPPDLKF